MCRLRTVRLWSVVIATVLIEPSIIRIIAIGFPLWFLLLRRVRSLPVVIYVRLGLNRFVQLVTFRYVRFDCRR